jgi:hypothetical protein
MAASVQRIQLYTALASLLYTCTLWLVRYARRWARAGDFDHIFTCVRACVRALCLLYQDLPAVRPCVRALCLLYQARATHGNLAYTDACICYLPHACTWKIEYTYKWCGIEHFFRLMDQTIHSYTPSIEAPYVYNYTISYNACSCYFFFDKEWLSYINVCFWASLFIFFNYILRTWYVRSWF